MIPARGPPIQLVVLDQLCLKGVEDLQRPASVGLVYQLENLSPRVCATLPGGGIEIAIGIDDEPGAGFSALGEVEGMDHLLLGGRWPGAGEGNDGETSGKKVEEP